MPTGTDLHPLPRTPQQPLFWIRQPKSRLWWLEDGVHRYASLERVKRFGSLFLAVIPGDRLTFKRVGWFHPRITMRAEGTEVERGVFQPRWTGGGDLRLDSGESFRWGCVGFWSTTWAFQDSQGAEQVRMRPRGLTGSRAEVTLGIGPARDPDRRALLAAFGWHALMLMNEDAGAVAAASAAAG